MRLNRPGQLAARPRYRDRELILRAESGYVCKEPSTVFRDAVLIVKNNVEKRTVDLKLTIVANEAQLPKPVHEKVNPQAVPRECDRFSTPARSARFPW